MLSEGDKAPAFRLRNQDGEDVSLADYAGKNVVVYFYPRADTPGCTKQACGIRDRASEYEAANAVVLGVSPDEPKALRKFADKYGLPFTLLGDPDHRTAEDYMGIQRSTFLVGPDGKIEWIKRTVKPADHDDLVLGALAAA